MRTVTVDLHGLTAAEAESQLRGLLKHCPADVSEIEVIHGYHGGQALMKMVRSFSHPKLEKRIIGMNSGVTIFILKKGVEK